MFMKLFYSAQLVKTSDLYFFKDRVNFLGSLEKELDECTFEFIINKKWNNQQIYNVGEIIKKY